MDPASIHSFAACLWFPRTRGDGPHHGAGPSVTGKVSPHTRGWTLPDGVSVHASRGFPAHAGMDRRPDRSRPDRGGFPRTRGDGPVLLCSPTGAAAVSPHTRGWTRSPRRRRWCSPGFPAHAGMDLAGCLYGGFIQRFPRTRGDGPAQFSVSLTVRPVSPHTRGWTPKRLARLGQLHGFPAHAGMDPRAIGPWATAAGFPRTRGDGPSSTRSA